MKRCPRCTVRGESDDTRFCPKCGTELFFEERFGKQFKDDYTKSRNKKNLLIALIRRFLK